MSARVRVGTSGWSYKHWKGVLYPEGEPQRRWFEIYADSFDTVEVNATFYRMMPESTFEGWRDKAPDGFVYAVKMWRMITHRKTLKDVEDMVADFLGRVAILGDRLGPILIQLPPSFHCDIDRLARFLCLLSDGFRYALEFRHASWLAEPVYDLLRERRIALCIFHHPRIDCPRVVTAPLVYLRFHGATTRYAGRYTTEHLRNWAGFARDCTAEGLDVVAYFNNDYKGYAVDNARELRELIEVKPKR
jgi:uncharacterized protein YecE (DUF72 family)